MSVVRALWRAAVAIFLFAYATAELIVTRPRTRPERAAWLSRFCKRALRRMQVSYTVDGPRPSSGAVVSNHLTFFDILLHSAVRPCVFVSKAELRSTPLLGWMSFMSGTVYVTRGGGGSAAAAATGMAKGFRDGLPVVFFPEGTTGTGEELVMPFRSGLLAQSIDAGAPVWAAFVRYSLSAQDIAEGKTLPNDVYWGPQSLLTLIWRFLNLHRLHATVRFAAEPIAFSDSARADRKIAAVEARAAVVHLAEAVDPQPVDAGVLQLP